MKTRNSGSDILYSCANEPCESYFSWSPCDACNGKLGGDRYDVIAVNHQTHEKEELSLCMDCHQRLVGGY